MKELVRHPPKYQLDDGSIQVWRGMPKLPDVVQVMLKLRDEAIMEAHRQEQERYSKEMAELKKRRDAGEVFYGEQDLAKLVHGLFKMDSKTGNSPTDEELVKRRDKMLDDLKKAEVSAKKET